MERVPPRDAQEVGLLIDSTSPHRLHSKLDPRPGVHRSDYGWIGEDETGVWITRDPGMVLSFRPHLWGVLDEILYCQTEEAPAQDMDAVSAHDFYLGLELRSSRGRLISHQIKEAGKNGHE